MAKEKRRYSFRVGAQDIDFRKELSLASFLNFIFNASMRDADLNGFGLLGLQAKNLTWVLSRLNMEMKRFPAEEESFEIVTWIENVGPTFTTRNFGIYDAKGEIIGYVSSSWAVIDMDTRQSVLLDTIPGLLDFVLPESVPIGIPERISHVKGTVENKFHVKYSHLDVNRHANSLYYIRRISDCFPLDFYLNHKIKRFEINFLKEITYGDKGEVFCEMKLENDYYFQLLTRDKGIVCRARLLFVSG